MTTETEALARWLERDAVLADNSKHEASASRICAAAARLRELEAAMLKQTQLNTRVITDRDRLRALVLVAKCPACDGSGAIPHGPDPDGDWQVEQCQWCYEQEALRREE